MEMVEMGGEVERKSLWKKCYFWRWFHETDGKWWQFAATALFTACSLKVNAFFLHRIESFISNFRIETLYSLYKSEIRLFILMKIYR